MNWIILVGLALFFLASALNDGARGWHFGDNGSMNMRMTVDGQTLDVKGEGDIDLAPDASGVAAIADGGYLDVRLARNGTERRARFAGENGGITRQFFVAGDEQPWSPEADRFVTEAMPILLRETGINVEERVAWLLENRGQPGLLDEIDLIRSDFAQRVYTVQYAETAQITDTDFQRLMGIIGSDMSSDFDVRTTLMAVYDAQMPAGDSFVALLRAGNSISSDFDTRVLLEGVGPRLPNAAEATTAYLDLADSISSDFDMRLALRPLVTHTDLADDLVARGIEMAGAKISSDFDLRTLLGEAATRVGQSDVLARAYTTAAGSISSDFDLRETLNTLASDAELTPAGWQMLLTSAQGIGSDFDSASLLMNVAPNLPADDEVIAAYRATLARIGSDFDRQRAAAALENATR